MKEDQLAQVVGVAQSMGAAVGEVRSPGVMNGPSPEAGQDADGIEGLPAVVGLDGVIA